MVTEIEAAELTSFETAPGGSRCRIHGLDTRGRHASLDLPSACLTRLTMTPTTPDGCEVSFSLQAADLLHIQQSVSPRELAAERPYLVKNR